MPVPARRRRLLLFAARCSTRLLMRRPPEDWSVPQADGRYGRAEGEGLRLVLLGDSLAQGVGVRRAEETLGARLATALAEALEHPVDLRVPARAGGTTRTLLRQATRTAAATTAPGGVAVVLVGGNDVMAPLPLGAAARRFALALGVLADAGWRLVVVPCPDPHDAPGFRVLPRLLASPRSRRLKRRQIRAAERLGALVAPSSTAPFLERAEDLLSADGVHPSAAGYADYAERMFPVLLTAARHGGTLPEQAVLGS